MVKAPIFQGAIKLRNVLDCQAKILEAVMDGRISGLLNFLLVYFSFLWKKELHVAAGDLSGTKDIA